MKQAKKQMMDIFQTSMFGSVSSVGLSGIGGTSAAHGQQGIANATGFLAPIGSFVGAGMLMRTLEGMDRPHKQKKMKPRW